MKIHKFKLFLSIFLTEFRKLILIQNVISLVKKKLILVKNPKCPKCFFFFNKQASHCLGEHFCSGYDLKELAKNDSESVLNEKALSNVHSFGAMVSST